jgi:hypothetical protein
MRKLTIGCVGIAVLALGASAQAAFTIGLSFSGLTASQQAVFSQAKSFWESNILDYKSGPDAVPAGISISAFGAVGDGPGGVLGASNNTAFLTANNYEYATSGFMLFDNADLSALESSGQLLSVIEHEMAHVIGFGTLWTENSVYTAGSGEYTGAGGLAADQIELIQPQAAFVPVELSGGGGSADAHWDEATGGSAATGVLDLMNRDKAFELMTAWLNPPAFVSNTTLQQFDDLGYVVAAAPVPEPTSLAVVAMAGAGLLIKRRRAA